MGKRLSKRQVEMKLRTQLVNRGFDAWKWGGEQLARESERVFGIQKPEAGAPHSSVKGRLKNALRVSLGLRPLTGRRLSEAAKDKCKAFYQSYEWAAVRMDALEQNDGRCECCGRNKHDGVTLNVDHIKPLRKYWNLRKDPNNLQVLCGLCNKGKGNRYETDWRQEPQEPQLSVVMGERVG